jgi:hypothetical protein
VRFRPLARLLGLALLPCSGVLNVKPGAHPVSFSKQQANFLGRAPSYLDESFGLHRPVNNTGIVDFSPFID